MRFSRRRFLKSLSRSALVLPFESVLAMAWPSRTWAFDEKKAEESSKSDLAVSFINTAREAGLNAKTIYGGQHHNKYLLETTGCGVAFYDYDNDGWLDIFLVNGTRLEGFPKGQEPTSHLFKNNRDGTFTDVTAKAGVAHSGWGQGVCIGDYDNDGYEDLFVSYFGKNVLYHNNGDSTFTDVSEKAGVAGNGKRWNTGCAFVDYDRDGKLDLFVANYIDMDLATAPLPESGPCLYKAVVVACGPPGLAGGKNILFHNNGDGTFSDVSEAAGLYSAMGTYGLGVLTADFDNDGWPDIYVANDSTASAFYQNKKNGKFEDIALEAGCALSPDGKPQAGMGVSAGDYDLDGKLDIVKTNFAGDTPSLYHNIGQETFDDSNLRTGVSQATRMLSSWGLSFFDYDNDGWPDLIVSNGHPDDSVESRNPGITYRQPLRLMHNVNGTKMENVTDGSGEVFAKKYSARGLAVGDLNNDGYPDVVFTENGGPAHILMNTAASRNHWLGLKLRGKVANPEAIGAMIRWSVGGRVFSRFKQSGGSFLSSQDPREILGAGKSQIDWVEIKWPLPSHRVDRIVRPAMDRYMSLTEGEHPTSK